jgi:hypothetical protein
MSAAAPSGASPQVRESLDFRIAGAYDELAALAKPIPQLRFARSVMAFPSDPRRRRASPRSPSRLETRTRQAHGVLQISSPRLENEPPRQGGGRRREEITAVESRRQGADVEARRR